MPFSQEFSLGERFSTMHSQSPSFSEPAGLRDEALLVATIVCRLGQALSFERAKENAS